MTSPTTIDLPIIGRLDYTSPGSISVALGAILGALDTLGVPTAKVAPYVASLAIALAVAGAIGWIAESIVKQHPRNVGQVITAAEHVATLTEVKHLIDELHAAVEALPAATRTRVAKAETAVSQRLAESAAKKK